MISKGQFTWTAVTLVWAASAFHPSSLIAQESELALDDPVVSEAAPSPALEAADQSDPVPAAEALQPTAANTELLTVPLAAPPALGSDQPLAAATVVQSRSGSGLGFMIAGGAALIAGLIIGGTAGDIIAVGGAVLGVWGIIVYF